MTAWMDINFNYILFIGGVIITGFVLGELANKIRLPKASGYLIAGILLNPDMFLSFISEFDFTRESNIALDIALAVIVFSIGGGLKKKEIKSLGRSMVSIGINQAEITLLVVTFGIIGFFQCIPGIDAPWMDQIIPLGIILGALALPTDPAAFLAVKHELRSKGKITSTTLGIAAIDDILTFLNFVIALSVARLFMQQGDVHISMELLKTFGEILLSITIGASMGYIFNQFTRLVRKETEGVLIVMTIGFIIFCFGLADMLGTEKLLANMTMGIVVVNFNILSKKIFQLIERYTEEFVFVIFFTLSGIQLDFSILGEIFILMIIFIVLRFAGKWAGTVSGAFMAGSDRKIKRLTTWALLPQGGIVIGLALTLKQEPGFSVLADIVIGVVIISSVFFEIIGSVTTKYALKKAGESGKDE
jgi:NhaP-type Na+/H+ or K+/H+ antiporter